MQQAGWVYSWESAYCSGYPCCVSNLYLIPVNVMVSWDSAGFWHIYIYIHTQWWFFENFSWKYGDFMGFALMGIQFCLCVAMVSWGFKPQITAFSWDEMELGMVLWEFKPKFQWFTLWEDVMELNPKYWRFQKKRISTMCFLVWGSKQIGGICLLHLYCFLLVRIYIYIYSHSSRRPQNIRTSIWIFQPPTPEYIYICIYTYS